MADSNIIHARQNETWNRLSEARARVRDLERAFAELTRALDEATARELRAAIRKAEEAK